MINPITRSIFIFGQRTHVLDVADDDGCLSSCTEQADWRVRLAGRLEQRQHNRLRLGRWAEVILAYVDRNGGGHLGEAHENSKHSGGGSIGQNMPRYRNIDTAAPYART
jgi:hypothetical protein